MSPGVWRAQEAFERATNQVAYPFNGIEIPLYQNTLLQSDDTEGHLTPRHLGTAIISHHSPSCTALHRSPFEGMRYII